MIHHVYANRSNIGDWLSAKGIQRLLRVPVTEYLCDEPFQPATLEALAALPAGACVVIGGGGHFMDYFAPFWAGLRELAPRLNLCIWGVGYCDLKNEPSHPPLDLVREVAHAARVCVVRDRLTRDYLGGGALPDPVPCPSIAAVEPAPPGTALLHVDNYTTAGADVYEVMDGVCRRHAAVTGRPFLRTNNRIERTTEAELARQLSLYERAGAVVSSALHGCVIAVAMGRPVVAVSGDRKIEGFMAMAGLADWVLDVSEVERLPALLERLHTQQPRSDFVIAARARNAEVAALVAAACPA